jgi:hypothetical protein
MVFPATLRHGIARSFVESVVGEFGEEDAAPGDGAEMLAGAGKVQSSGLGTPAHS